MPTDCQERRTKYGKDYSEAFKIKTIMDLLESIRGRENRIHYAKSLNGESLTQELEEIGNEMMSINM